MEAKVFSNIFIDKIRNFLGSRKTKIIIVIIVAIIILVTLAMFTINKVFGKNTNIQQQRTYVVSKGTVAQTIIGSGVVASSETNEIIPMVSASIKNIYFKEKDKVKKGDLLFELDDTDAKINVEKIENSIAQQKLNTNNTVKSINSMKIYAPMDGQVSGLNVKEGDSVSKGAPILNITDSSKFKLSVQFIKGTFEISPGQNVKVNVQDTTQTVKGVVNTVVLPPNTNVYDVEVIVENPGALKEGMKATAVIENKDGNPVASRDAAKLEILGSSSVKCDTSGNVSKVYIKNSQYVKKGQLLIELSSDELDSTKKANELKENDLNNQLEAAKKQLSQYKIYSPADGLIVKINAKPGDNVKQGISLATIIDDGHFEFTMNVDELDIAKVQVGQKVKVTVDALLETKKNPYWGEVKDIGITGNSSNGVTTFPVIIKLNNIDNLRVGMNVSGEILIIQKDDVVRIPLEAIQKRGDTSFVFVKSNIQDSTNEGQRQRDNGQGGWDRQRGSDRPNQTLKNSITDYYRNTIRKDIVVGITNEEYAEVVSGLEEGEEIVLPPLSTGSAQNNSGMFPGMNGMGRTNSGNSGVSNQNFNRNNVNNSNNNNRNNNETNENKGNNSNEQNKENSNSGGNVK